MVNKLLVVVILLMLIPVVYGAAVINTKLTVNTEPNYDVEIKVTNAETGEKVQSFPPENSGSEGKIEVEISSIGTKEVNVEVSLIKDFVQVLNDISGPYSVKSPITISLPLETEEENVSAGGEVKEEPEKEEKAEVTGKAIFGKEGVIKPKILLYILIVIVLGVGGFFGFKVVAPRIKTWRIPKNIIVKKQSDLLKEREESDRLRELSKQEKIEGEELDRIYARLKELEQEINKIRNRDKIRDAEERLEKLRKGEED